MSEAMDMSSDFEDDLSENMELSSGPDADNMSDEELSAERMGGTVSRAISLQSDQEVDPTPKHTRTSKEELNMHQRYWT